MKVNVINTVPTFLEYWNNAHQKSVDEKKALWSTKYHERWKEIFDVYFTNWGGMGLLDKSIARYSESITNIKSNAEGIEERILKIVDDVERIFGEVDLEINLIILVGFYCSNGWVTSFEGKKSIFVAAEFYDNESYLNMLIAHEIAHVLYHEVGNIDLKNGNLGVSIFDEGIATYVTKIIFKGHDEHEYIWTSDKYYDYWKKSNDILIELSKDARSVLEFKDSDLYNQYFSMSSSNKRVPIRSGYNIGFNAVKLLSRQYSLQEMTKWNNGMIVSKLQTVL